ncbi:MAG: indolepyruvate oxidoreductase subunit beta [Candidatus Njordarchaeales archaeon]
MEEFNIVIAGVGGQGGLTLSRIIAYAALFDEYMVRVGETLGMSQRGGAVTSFVRFGKRVFAPIIPEGGAHLMIGLEPVEALRNINFVSDESIVLLNEYPMEPLSVNIGIADYPSKDHILELLETVARKVIIHNFYEEAKKLGTTRIMNVIMLGYAIGRGLIPLSEESVVKAIKAVVPEKYADLNIRAYNHGKKLAEG